MQNIIWKLKAIALLPSYLYSINLKVRLSKEVRDLKKLVKGFQDAYSLECKIEGKKNHQRLHVRHETYDRVLNYGLMHDLIIEDRDFWLGTIRIVVEAVRKSPDSPELTYTKSYLVQNMGEQFKACESVADAIQKLDSIKFS